MKRTITAADLPNKMTPDECEAVTDYLLAENDIFDLSEDVLDLPGTVRMGLMINEIV